MQLKITSSSETDSIKPNELQIKCKAQPTALAAKGTTLPKTQSQAMTASSGRHVAGSAEQEESISTKHKIMYNFKQVVDVAVVAVVAVVVGCGGTVVAVVVAVAGIR